MQASEDYDYAAMTFYTDSLERIRYSAALNVNNISEEGALSMTGFGQDIVPVVRLSIGADPNTVSTSEPQLPETAVAAFPNPADAFVNVDFNLETPTNGTLLLFDTKGQIVYSRTLDNVSQDRIRVETTELPAGTYLLRVSTEQGVRNMKISVQH
ncbi:MAG: T9SS type A sorting domain-containing protein [Saprospiraceae bacterium]